MINKTMGIQAYQQNMGLMKRQKMQSSIEDNVATKLAKPQEPRTSFGDTIKESLDKVNEMQSEKKSMIESFAAGEKTNVHELMITMQKAGLAMNMTSAVRGKIISAYQEIMRLSF
ncbi:flagellar hook-basal body complex protein FliE [Salidesulfovibrio onnuriiensis]|uniref:flagellar hook-basal body complex protein FliE n=1 Tax=Salidesulfovibrio onnuriiensis TaxID=2583823 RepID=UPI0011CC87A3|nr:flagellar hook-basal body complex protein FliE [Salidesulfovibrio onnuriiensis]